MSAINHRVTQSVSSDSGSTSLSGYDTEGGATEILVNSTFPAAASNSPLTLSFTVAALQSVFLVSDKGLTLKINGGAGSADVQTVSITGTPAGGTFSLAYQGEITSPIAFNAAAAAVQTALRALSTIGGTNITCTGGALPGTPVVCTFSGTMATGFRPLITANSGGLTGGSTPTVSVAHTTSGTPSDTIVLQPGIPLIWSRSAGYFACPFTANVTSATVSCTPASRLQGKILTS